MQVTVRAARKHKLVQTSWFHTLSKCTFVCSGSPADGEANGRQVAGRTKDSQFQRQHPQPETLHPRCPPHVVEEQTSRQVPGRLLTCTFRRVQSKDLLDELVHFPPSSLCRSFPFSKCGAVPRGTSTAASLWSASLPAPWTWPVRYACARWRERARYSSLTRHCQRYSSRQL